MIIYEHKLLFSKDKEKQKPLETAAPTLTERSTFQTQNKIYKESGHLSSNDPFFINISHKSDGIHYLQTNDIQMADMKMRKWKYTEVN